MSQLKVLAIIDSLSYAGIPVEVVRHNGEMAYEVHIGSKTGTGTLYVDGEIYLKTRYGQVDEVTSFEDISRVAFDWFMNYQTREPFGNPSECWAKIWVESGLLEEISTTVTEYVVA
tara:strand:- start:3867 stop:4214 length:348 start_codon:yes stop_codon:yes gene_type:complete